MRRPKKIKRRDQHPEATEADYKTFAGQFAEMLIDPDKPWLLEYVLAGGFTYSLDSLDDLALDILTTVKTSYFIDTKLFDAVQAGDRGPVIAFFVDNFRRTKPSKEWLSAILEALQTNQLRRSLDKAAGMFKLRRGRNPKIPIFRYKDLAANAELLTPVIAKLLKELQSGTKRSVDEYLGFWKVDHPEACSFLLRHVGRLQQALDNPALLKRGKKIGSRAHVLAEALAGSDYGLKFSTSLARVRQAKVSPSVS